MDAASSQPLKDKGTDPRSILTSSGRVSIRRRRWQAKTGGGVMPVEALLDAAEATVKRVIPRFDIGVAGFRAVALIHSP